MNRDDRVQRLRALRGDFDGASGDVVLGEMVVELGALVADASDSLDRAQRSAGRLSWAMLLLSAVTLAVGAAQLYYAARPSQSVRSAPVESAVSLPPIVNSAQVTERSGKDSKILDHDNLTVPARLPKPPIGKHENKSPAKESK
jgi:hypothetical protein